MNSERSPRHKYEPSVERERKKQPNKAAYYLAVTSMAMVSGLFVASSDAAQGLAYNVRIASRDTEQNTEASQFATNLAGTTIHVDCNDEALDKLDEARPLSENGMVYTRAGSVIATDFPIDIGPKAMTVRESICESITTFDPAPPQVTEDSPAYQAYLQEAWDYADSVATILHEIEHTNQVSAEAEADCYAYQKLPGALASLGMDQVMIENMTPIMAYTRTDTTMSEYISDECRPGGAYDLGINDLYLEPLT